MKDTGSNSLTITIANGEKPTIIEHSSFSNTSRWEALSLKGETMDSKRRFFSKSNAIFSAELSISFCFQL